MRYGSFVMRTSPGSRLSGGYSSQHGRGATRQGVDVARRAGDGLGDHAALAIEDAVRQVAGLPDDRAERGTLQRLGLLVDGGDQTLPEDFELDGVETAHFEPPRVATRLPSAATVTLHPRPDHRGGLTLLDDGGTVEGCAGAERVAPVHGGLDGLDTPARNAPDGCDAARRRGHRRLRAVRCPPTVRTRQRHVTTSTPTSGMARPKMRRYSSSNAVSSVASSAGHVSPSPSQIVISLP